jgi:hypothetical protein
MIDTLIGKIAGLFEKDFLFASFLPSLIFLSVMVATFAFAVGIEGVWAWINSWSASDQAVILAVSGFAVVMFAYVMQAMRSFFAHLWSGDVRFPLAPLLWLGEKWQRRRYEIRRDRKSDFTDWNEVRLFFEAEVLKALQQPNLPSAALPGAERQELVRLVTLLDQTAGADKIKNQLRNVIDAYEQYAQQDLHGIYASVKKTLLDWNEVEMTRLQTEIVTLDRLYGSYSTVKATRLGNIIASYNGYASKRYKIETEVFWPRLQKVITPEYAVLVREPRILLDFAVTMSSLSALYAYLILLTGPWIWFRSIYWVSLALFAGLVSFFFYQVSVSAAIQLGELMRASFDLFRLDLMNALGRPHPNSFHEEQRQWKELNDLAVYGDAANDFKIVQPAVSDRSEKKTP